MGEKRVWLRCCCRQRHWNPVKPAGPSEVRANANERHFNACSKQVLNWGVPGGLVALRPWTEGWLCRSKLPAGGSTPPRQHCSLAGLQAGRLPPPLEPEGLPDLEKEKRRRTPSARDSLLMPQLAFKTLLLYCQRAPSSKNFSDGRDGSRQSTEDDGHLSEGERTQHRLLWVAGQKPSAFCRGAEGEAALFQRSASWAQLPFNNKTPHSTGNSHSFKVHNSNLRHEATNKPSETITSGSYMQAQLLHNPFSN